MPRLAASVETSKSIWLLMSRFDTSSSLMVPLTLSAEMSGAKLDMAVEIEMRAGYHEEKADKMGKD